MSEAFNSVLPDNVVSLIRRFNSHPVADLVKKNEFWHKRISHFQNVIHRGFDFSIEYDKHAIFNRFFELNIHNRYKNYITKKIKRETELMKQATVKEKHEYAAKSFMVNMFLQQLQKNNQKYMIGGLDYSNGDSDEEYM